MSSRRIARTAITCSDTCISFSLQHRVDEKLKTTTEKPAAGPGDRLPDTATNQFNIMMIGGLFLLLGVASFFITKRRKAIH